MGQNRLKPNPNPNPALSCKIPARWKESENRNSSIQPNTKKKKEKEGRKEWTFLMKNLRMMLQKQRRMERTENQNRRRRWIRRRNWRWRRSWRRRRRRPICVACAIWAESPLTWTTSSFAKSSLNSAIFKGSFSLLKVTLTHSSHSHNNFYSHSKKFLS